MTWYTTGLKSLILIIRVRKEYRRRYGRRLRCERSRGKEGRLKDEDSEEIIPL
jgi:hypothetical protein